MNLCSNSHEPGVTKQRAIPKVPKADPSAELTIACTVYLF